MKLLSGGYLLESPSFLNVNVCLKYLKNSLFKSYLNYSDGKSKCSRLRVSVLTSEDRRDMSFILWQVNVRNNRRKSFTSINLQSFTFRQTIDFCILVVDHTRQYAPGVLADCGNV